jgi:Methyltransferase domain
VTGFDSSPTAIEQARTRASEAGVQARFDVADVTESTGYDRQFDTVIDSALYHCLDNGGRQAYAAALHRATTPRARWFLYCFSGENVNGVIAPMEAVPEADIRDTLGNAGWRIDFLGPTSFLGNISFLGNTSGFTGSFGKLPEALLRQMHPSRPNRWAAWPRGWPPSCRSSTTGAFTCRATSSTRRGSSHRRGLA